MQTLGVIRESRTTRSNFSQIYIVIISLFDSKPSLKMSLRDKSISYCLTFDAITSAPRDATNDIARDDETKTQ